MLPDIPPCTLALRVLRQRTLAGGAPVGYAQSLEPTSILHGLQTQNFRKVRSMKTQGWMESCFFWKLTENHWPFGQAMSLRWHSGSCCGHLSLEATPSPGCFCSHSLQFYGISTRVLGSHTPTFHQAHVMEL